MHTSLELKLVLQFESVKLTPEYLFLNLTLKRQIFLTLTLLTLLLLSSACCSVQDTLHHPIIFVSLKIACVIWNDVRFLYVIPSS